MANFYGTSRSNYVFVKDADAAIASLADFDINVHRHPNHDNAIMLSGNDDDGTFSTSTLDDDGDEIYLDFSEWAQEHLVDGQTLILVSAGAEKLRYVSAWAEAYTWRGERVDVNLMESLYQELEKQTGISAGKVADPTYQETCDWKPE